jgi:two-component system, cell cycle response regulator DivK
MTRPCILVVEDDDAFREILETKLTAEGYDVVPVTDGLDAMQYLAEARAGAPKHPAPDLLITDIYMPRSSGIDLLAYTRLWPVATIVVTGFMTQETLDEAHALGAAAYLRKPIKLDALCATVRRLAPIPNASPGRR